MVIKVTVIIPVYNLREYLVRTVDSVVNQSLKEIEILIIDDGSTDDSINIIKMFASIDERIVLYSQPNSGVSLSRNKGIKMAKGEYILFLDGDDTLELNALEKLYKRAKKTNLDIVVGNATVYSLEGKVCLLFNHSRRNLKLNNVSGEALFSILMSNNIFPPLSVLYFCRRKYILDNSLFFKENIIHEDELWCVKVLCKAKNVSLAKFSHYCYFQRYGSIMNSDNLEFRVHSLYIVVKELLRFVDSEKNLSTHTRNIVYSRVYWLFNQISILTSKLKDQIILIDDFRRLLLSVYETLDYNQQQYCLYSYKFSILINNTHRSYY